MAILTRRVLSLLYSCHSLDIKSRISIESKSSNELVAAIGKFGTLVAIRALSITPCTRIAASLDRSAGQYEVTRKDR